MGPSLFEMYKTPSHIKWLDFDNVIILLDANKGKYFGLNGSECSAWRSFCTLGKVDQKDVEFFRSLHECGIVAKNTLDITLDSASSIPLSLLSSFSSFLCSIYIVQLSLKIRGFGFVYRNLISISNSYPRTNAIEINDIACEYIKSEKYTQIGITENNCLIRSFAFFRSLRLLGVDAKHLIGIAVHPFQAHAWVEIDGVPILDDTTSSRGQFTPIAIIE